MGVRPCGRAFGGWLSVARAATWGMPMTNICATTARGAMPPVPTDALYLQLSMLQRCQHSNTFSAPMPQAVWWKRCAAA